MAVYQYIRYINLCQKVVKSMITWKTINILYFKDAVNFGLQMSLVTDWKVKLNKHSNNISDLHLLLTCQAFCWLCVRTSVNSSYLGGASVHWFAAGSVSVYCTGCGFNDTWYTPCGETRSVVVILLRSGGPEKSTYPVPGTRNKKYEYQSYYVLAVCPTCILLKRAQNYDLSTSTVSLDSVHHCL